jgi:hypothetical protein
LGEGKKRKRQKKYQKNTELKTEDESWNRVQSAVASPRHPKQTNDNSKEFASLPKTISTTTRYPSLAGCQHSILRSSPGPLCVLLVLDRAGDPILHSVGHLSSRVKVRVVGRRSCPCSACVRLHVLRFTRPTLVDHKISSSTCRIG